MTECAHCGEPIFGGLGGYHTNDGAEVCPSGVSPTTFHEIDDPRQGFPIKNERVMEKDFSRVELMRTMSRWMVAWFLFMCWWFFRLGYAAGGRSWRWGLFTMIVCAIPFVWAGHRVPQLIKAMARDDENSALAYEISLKERAVALAKEEHLLEARSLQLRVIEESQAADLTRLVQELTEETES